MVRVFEQNILLDRKITVQNCSPSFSSILAGIAYGDVWVNDMDTPTLALIYSNPVGGYRIVGSFKSDSDLKGFISFLKQELFPMLMKNNINEFEFSVDNPDVEKLLLEHLSRYKIITDKELTFIKEPIEGNKRLCEDNKAEDFKIVEVNNVNPLRNYNNNNFVLSRIMDSWGSDEMFSKYGKAFIAIVENKIVGMILGSAFYDNMLAIDIVTLPDYRKRGIASALTHQLIRYCQEAKITAYWNCTTDNIGSHSVAKRTGFKYVGENNYYYFSIV